MTYSRKRNKGVAEMWMGQSVRALGLVIEKEQNASNGGDRGSVTRLQGVPLSLHKLTVLPHTGKNNWNFKLNVVPFQ